GIAKEILARGLHDQEFIARSTEGLEAFVQQVQGTSWEEIERRSGVPRDQIVQAAEWYGSARSAILAWTMGITHHLHGSDNVRMIANLALLRGMVGRPGAGLMPIRGHSNVQG